MRIGILALQGAFIEHSQMLAALDVPSFEIRQRKDLDIPCDGLIIPGGESTVQGKLLRDLEMFDPLNDRIRNGLPVFGTCAGLLLLAKEIENDQRSYFATMDIKAIRNGYGRQLGSFHTTAPFKCLGDVEMTFIRAPYVVEMDKDALASGNGQILAVVNNRIVGVRYKNQFAFAFHPELDQDTRIHEVFLGMIR